ncbi:MAG: sigma 54-interacting transcriptional regulator [Deltaproteobacteria bacterium]|nr:sigma 54-interacting transcriptional regulator [Deltaproteobacteria bacterium]
MVPDLVGDTPRKPACSHPESRFRAYNGPVIVERPELDLKDFHGIRTVAPQMLELFELVERAARTDSAVLIRGESGTGKELIARALHEMSGRAHGPFRALNCATLTPELLASELFGHVRGAFTGAVRDRQGLFAAADGGTIFLDEVAEMPLGLQAQLLRVVEAKSFVPVGATEPVTVDVRIMSATNQALRLAVEDRRFREDLMYRIRVVPLFLPRLAERDGDVEALTWHFIDRHNQLGLRNVEAIDSQVLEALLDYGWPGNVRELQNVVEFAFAIGEGPTFTPDELTPELRGEPPTDHVRRSGSSERHRIEQALSKAGGRKGKAAELLGMSRSTLWRKLREYRLG